jgi:extracellular elastinolytic metalloproteinase
MGHYITNRLIGNGNGLTNTQGSAMGEGWGDFFAICMTSQDGDDFGRGVFAVGGWTDVTDTFKQNYYFSIRRYPLLGRYEQKPPDFQAHQQQCCAANRACYQPEPHGQQRGSQRG